MKRILTIDGGGLKGVFPAAFLAELERRLGRPVAEHFDLIAGTSTGGIIAIGLGLGLSSQQLCEFYEKHGPEIFSGQRLINNLKRLVRPKYGHDVFRKVLEARFGQKRLGHSTVRLIIPSLNLSSGRVRVYRTPHHRSHLADATLKAVDVALASASAPSYFPTFRDMGGDSLIDGSMWARNPVGAAVVEAIGILGWKREEIQVLSIGCTSRPMQHWVTDEEQGGGYWLRRLADLFMKAQSSGALATACALVGEENVTRINPDPGEGYAIDMLHSIPLLKRFGEQQAAEWLPKLEPRFFHSPVAEPFGKAATRGEPTREEGDDEHSGDSHDSWSTLASHMQVKV